MEGRRVSPLSPDSLETVIGKLRERESYLRERYGVLSLGVFGSWVRGDTRSASDLDLLVEFDDRPLSLFQFIALQNELAELLGVKVDLVEKEALKPRIGERILDEVVYV